MLTELTIKTLRNRINNIISNLAHKDFLVVNQNSPRMKLGKFTTTGNERKWLSYNLSDETLEAVEMLKLITDNMCRESEIIVKEYIMKCRLITPELLEDSKYNT